MTKQFEELRQAYKELLADNQQLTADNRKLRKEVTELKQLNDGYVKIIAKNQETNNKLMASVQKQTGGDYISRADAIEAVRGLSALVDDKDFSYFENALKALPSANCIEFDFNKYQPRVRNKVNDGTPSADAVSDAYKRGFEDCKRAYEIELARSADANQNNGRLINADALMDLLKARKQFFVDAYGGSFHCMSEKDKARCDEIDSCIASIVNAQTASADAEFADLPDIPRAYYERIVGNMAHEINMLKEQLESADAVQSWNNHEVACMLAELFGDTCACNYNSIDEWLPLVCDFKDICPNTVGVACWEQFLKHYGERKDK